MLRRLRHLERGFSECLPALPGLFGPCKGAGALWFDVLSRAENHASEVNRGAEKSTAAFRLKVLQLHLREHQGGESAQTFAEALGGEAVLSDETRPISHALWVRGVEDFVRRAGVDSLSELTPYFRHPEVVSVWARLLSGASAPEDVFRSLCEEDRLPGDGPWTQATQSGDDWIIQAEAFPEEPERTQEYLKRALESELRVLPTLLGHRAICSRMSPPPPSRFRVRLVPLAPSRASIWFGASLIALSWIAMTSFVPNFGHPSPVANAFWGALVALAFGLGSEIYRRERSRRAHAAAQTLRIMALEREAALRSERGRALFRANEEPIIAGKYRIGLPLGSGAAGAVWSATRLTDGEEVALKLVRTAVAHDVRATDRLRREAEALELVWHPHVVEVFESGLLPSGTAFLAMAQLRGETLADRLSREGPLEPMEVRTLGLQLADALVAVHSAGVIHRDIKPTNLFLHRNDDDQIILKLIDFGVAHIAWAETRITRSGMRIGTMGYAAPEQEDGADVAAQADLYSVGITLYECLTGTPRLRDDPPPSGSDPGIPESFREIILRLTRVAPEERFSSARELKETLLALSHPSDDAIPLPVVRSARVDAAPYADLDAPTLKVPVVTRR